MEQSKQLLKTIRKRYNDKNNTKKYLRIISRDTIHYVVQGEKIKRIEVYDIPKYDEVKMRPSKAIISIRERCFAKRRMIDLTILQREWAKRVHGEDDESIEDIIMRLERKSKN